MRLTPDTGSPRIRAMILARNALRRSRDLAFLLFCGLVIDMNPARTLQSAEWNREAAKAAWVEAEKLLGDLSSAPEPSRESYLKCIRTYQKVYTQDPHYGYSPDAIFEAAKLFQAMGEKFADLSDYRNAVRLYRFLASDYGQSPRCPEALLRLGTLCEGPLKDPEAAKEAYQRLRTVYKWSAAAATLATRSAESSKPAALSIPAPPVLSQPRTAQMVAGPAGSVSATIIKSINVAPLGNHTRVSIASDAQIHFSKGSLSNPDRIYFDIKDVQLDNSILNKTLNVEDKFLKQVRLAQSRPDLVRIVFDLGDGGGIVSSESSERFGVVVDLHGKDYVFPSAETAAKSSSIPGQPKEMTSAANSAGSVTAAGSVDTSRPRPRVDAGSPASVPNAGPAPKIAAATTDKAPGVAKTIKDDRIGPSQESTVVAKDKEVNLPAAGPAAKEVAKPISAQPASGSTESMPKAPLPTSHGDRTLTRTLGLKIGRIVLDPGHGGRDTGTIGPSGTLEKDLVLDIAKDLEKLLEERLGAQVVLTRSDDSFVALEERPLLANEQQADLFVSIHANSSTVRSVSGVETYFLDFARTDSAREVATRENASSDRNIRDLQNLILKIVQADKLQESRELASTIQKTLYDSMHKLMPGSMNRGVRSAPFIVLIGAQMPSILAEVSFLSNPQDEKLLQKGNCRQTVALALFQGIETYMKSLGSAVAINRDHKN